MSIITINPATGETLNEYREYDQSEINSIISSVSEAWKSWSRTSFKERSGMMKNAAEILRNKKEEFGRLMANEMGKPLQQAVAEADKCSWVCDYYADNAEHQLEDMSIKTEMKKSFVSMRPLGTVLAIMPWNFPFWQVFRFAAPTLMAGNTGILKHSRNTMGCAVAIENIFKEAGFPENVFRNLQIGSKPVESVIKNSDIAAVTLTGSTPVGMMVAEQAGSVLKKTVLELGGSDPYVILEDADLGKASETCAIARLMNSGQSCIAAKRFIVVESVKEEFERFMTEQMNSHKMGDPMEDGVMVGPQARKDLQEDLVRQVDESIKMGARLLLGGEVPDSPGYYYPPTVLTDVRKGMPAYDEELFGPVAAIISAENEEDAINKANDTIFGLGAAVFTEDIERGERIARDEIQAGACFVNAFVKSDPRLPFGGIKQSGYGRELSLFGIREFLNIKTICVG